MLFLDSNDVISLIDYIVKGNHIIHHSTEDKLESEREAISNYARVTQSRTVPGKLVNVVHLCHPMGM